MKKNFKRIFNVIIYISFIVSIISHITVNKSITLNNSTKLLKEMNESTQITDLNNSITALQTSHTEYANYIQESKQKIANAITMYSSNNITDETPLEDFSTMITNLTNFPENTFYYEKGTEGNSSTIVRYKKIDNNYYVCDSNGIVLDGTIPTDISAKTLEPYTSADVKNISAGSAGYVSGSLHLGDGSDNSSYIEHIIGGIYNGQKYQTDNVSASISVRKNTYLSDSYTGDSKSNSVSYPIYDKVNNKVLSSITIVTSKYGYKSCGCGGYSSGTNSVTCTTSYGETLYSATDSATTKTLVLQELGIKDINSNINISFSASGSSGGFYCTSHSYSYVEYSASVSVYATYIDIS